MSRKGQRGRSSIDNVLDDLLASDDDVFIKKPAKPSPATTPGNKKNVKLTSDASDAEFYKNLRQITGKSDFDNENEESEEEALSDDAAKRLADDIGDLDDLDNDLFAGLKSNKKNVSKKEEKKKIEPKKATRKSKINADYDLNDPLSGLLSDEDEFANKSKTSPKKSLSRRLSNDRFKVEPSLKSDDNDSKHDLDPTKDPFLFPDAKETKINRASCFDDPTGSESEIVSPRQQSIGKKGKVRPRRGSVEPSIPGNDVTDTKNDKKRPGKNKPHTDDIFGDSDGLPGFSDDEISSPRATKEKKKTKGISDDLIPQEKASSALDNLLNSSPAHNKQAKKPTMLDQMMAGKTNTNKDNKDSIDEDFQFGGYAPSLGGDRNRPTTAPDKRSVRFADELGLDLNDESITRPGTAPTKKSGTKGSGLLDSSLEENSGKDFFSAVRKRNSGRQKEKQEEEPPKTNQKKGRVTKQQSKDDWLGLGDDHTEEVDLLSSGELFSPRNKPRKQTNTETPRKDSPKAQTKDELALPWDTDSPINKRQTAGRRQNAKEPESEKNQDENNSDDFLSLLKTKKQQKAAESPKHAIIQNEVKSNEQEQPMQPSQQTQHQQQQFQQPMQQQQQLQQHMQQSQQHSQQPVQQFQQPLQQQQQQPLQHVIPTTATQPANTQQTVIAQQATYNPQQQMPYQQQPQSNFLIQDSDVLQRMRNDIQQDLSKQYQDEFNASKRQFEREKTYLESELRELQARILKIDESRSTKATNYDGKIRDLETKLGKLELERDQLLLSIDSTKQRHKDEINALENSHKNRLGYMEDSYKRREQQMRDENTMMFSHHEEKERAMKIEKEDLTSAHKKKCELITQNHVSELDRLRELHKKTMEDVMKEHNEQMNHLRIVKEQEVNAASSAFSHTKSLQTLMMEMKNSTKELNNLQIKIDASHSNKLNDREISLKSRDEYLRNLESKLHAQESSNDEERQRLQNLVSKMEIQLREQTRQLEHDKWKLVQDDNRIKAMQAAIDEERRAVNEQLSNERQQLARSREEMLAEQRRIIAECYEEKRKVTEERNQLSMIQRDGFDRSRMDRSASQVEPGHDASWSRYQYETSNFSMRLAQVKKQEDELAFQKEEFLQQKKMLEKEFEQLRQASVEVQKRSEEVEKFAKEASRVHEEGEKALEDAHLARSEFVDGNQAVEARSFSLEQQERFLNEERERLKNDRNQLNLQKKMNICSICQGQINPIVNQAVPNTSLMSSLTNPVHVSPLFSPQLTNQIRPSSLSTNQNPASPRLFVSSLPNQIQSKSLYSPQRTNPIHQPVMLTSSLANQQTTDISRVPVQKDFNTTYSFPDNDSNNNSRPNITSTSKSNFDFSVDSLLVHTQSSQTHQAPSILHSTAENIYQTSSPLLDPPPDLLLDNIEFKRTMQRWTSAKEKDDDFFEEEQMYLKSLQSKRMR